MSTAIKLEVSFEQVLNLVKQLPKKDKLKLFKELEREAIDSRLTKSVKDFKAK